MRIRPIIVAALGLALAGAEPALAAGFSLSLYGGIGLKAERLSLSHDASAFDPFLGSPTSTLDYAPLATVLPQIGLRGENDSGDWLDFMLTGTPIAQGSFIDSDYFSNLAGGNLLVSQTRSAVGIGGAVSGELRVSLPYRPAWTIGGAPVVPYFVARAGHRRLTALGLSCGSVCAPPLPAFGPDVAIIEDDMWSAAAGLGLEAKMPLTAADTLTLAGDLAAGFTEADDSHNFRPDLGPTPNVVYDFATVGARGRVAYAHRLADALELDLALDLAAKAGFGQVRFGPRSATPAGPFPATLTDIGATLSAGLSGRF